MEFMSEELMFHNYNNTRSVLTSYFIACDLLDVVFEESSGGLHKRFQEMKEGIARNFLQKVTHQEIWKNVGDTRSPSDI